MPWIALDNGEKKGPFQVPIRTDVECPTCGGRMRVWGESSDGRARHFKHIGEMGHGEGGGGGAACEAVAESDKHLKWKNLAAERLSEVFNDQLSECRVGMELDAPVSEKGRRVGDVVVLFEGQDSQLGRGLVVEVQYRNHSKDVEETTQDYIAQDLAVVWTNESDYGSDRYQLAEVDLRNRAREVVWPTYVPKADQWWTPEYNHRAHQLKWQNSFRSELVQSGAPATLPPDWVDEKAREIWEAQYWPDLFPAEDAFGQYESETYIQEVRESLSGSALPDVRLPPEWCDEAAQKLWNRQPWAELFTTDPDRSRYESERYIDEVREMLDAPIMTIDWLTYFPEDMIRGWHSTGIEMREDTKRRLPRPAQWGGVTPPEFDYSPPQMEVKLPQEFVDEHREELRLHWQYGAGTLSLDVARQMKSHNAGRPCAVCSAPADYYLLKSDILSEYRCLDCALELVRSKEELRR